MNKENLMLSIGNIPKFVLRDISIQKGLGKTFADDGTIIYSDGVNEWKEEENWKAVTEKDNLKPLTFVSKRYQLIQFKEVFLPLIENIPELEGDVIYYGGIAYMDIFPTDEKLKVNGGDKIGLVACNSVNKTSSVFVNFCIEHNGKLITVPKRIAGFKRVHTGKVIEMTQNFLEVVDKVRTVWKTILEEFGKIEVDETYAKNILNECKITDNYIVKSILKFVTTKEKPTLWDMFLRIIDTVEIRNFKSSVHRRKKLDLISERIFKYAIVSRLINA